MVPLVLLAADTLQGSMVTNGTNSKITNSPTGGTLNVAYIEAFLWHTNRIRIWIFIKLRPKKIPVFPYSDRPDILRRRSCNFEKKKSPTYERRQESNWKPKCFFFFANKQEYFSKERDFCLEGTRIFLERTRFFLEQTIIFLEGTRFFLEGIFQNLRHL